MRAVDPPILEGYEFIRPIGSGGTASVFLYHQQMPDRLVAIKVSSKPGTTGRASDRFLHEANFLARLSANPYILSLYEAGITDDERWYLVCEYAPGGNYKTLMRTHPLDPERVTDLGVKMASALYTAHRNGIIHRDVKPANMLVTTQELPVLADFGIAATIYATPDARGFSVPWAPPEVLSGQSGGSEASDIYSLGASLFGLLAGRSPFEYGYDVHDHDELANAIITQPLPRITNQDVPDDLELTLRTSLAHDPEDRYFSALDMARDLQSVQERHYGHVTPVIAPDTPAYSQRRSRRSTVRRPHPRSTSVARAGAASGSSGSGRAWAPRTGAPRRSAARSPAWRWAGLALIVIACMAGAFLLLRPMLGRDARHSGLDPGVTSTPSQGQPTPSGGQPTVQGPVPSPQDLHGSYSGATVTFQWRNPDPQPGDHYVWKPVSQGNDDVELTDTDEARATLRQVAGRQTCIQVSIVRANRQISQSPAIACAVRE